MRPGDVILFNSNVFHCLTGKTEAYRDLRVYVTSFYLKTGHVSGNDNSGELSQDELEYLRMDFG
jgi:ectoine hydroxylase-related dioxygenase (phytanoyl-CoA dioxygenase family)